MAHVTHVTQALSRAVLLFGTGFEVLWGAFCSPTSASTTSTRRVARPPQRTPGVWPEGAGALWGGKRDDQTGGRWLGGDLPRVLHGSHSQGHRMSERTCGPTRLPRTQCLRRSGTAGAKTLMARVLSVAWLSPAPAPLMPCPRCPA
uniref:Uncharacterized protein n=1 Tax=Eutreptiella gymnastica TaxID=73025 RepID=A0A7S4GPM9_9EUGL